MSKEAPLIQQLRERLQVAIAETAAAMNAAPEEAVKKSGKHIPENIGREIGDTWRTTSL